MNKYFKKFSIMFVMLLAVISIGMIQNGTVAKAATIGQQLLQPEDGWKRYDDTYSGFNYGGNWTTIPNGHTYTYNKGSVTFYAYTSRIRLFDQLFFN